jgi:hypothetical protein
VPVVGSPFLKREELEDLSVLLKGLSRTSASVKGTNVNSKRNSMKCIMFYPCLMYPLSQAITMTKQDCNRLRQTSLLPKGYIMSDLLALVKSVFGCV